MSDDDDERPEGPEADERAETVAEAGADPSASDAGSDEASVPVMTAVREGPEGEVVEAEEVRRRGRTIGIALGIGVALAASIGGALYLYASSVEAEEAAEWAQAERGARQESWERYVAWANEARASGGLRGHFLASTPMEEHAASAAERELVARTDAAAAQEDWPALCEILRDHPGTPASEHATQAFARRIDAGIGSYRQLSARRGTPGEVVAAVIDAMTELRDHDPCAEGAVVRVVHEVPDAPALGQRLGEEGTVADVLRGLLTEERAAAIVASIDTELSRATAGVLHARAPVDGETVTPALDVRITSTFAPRDSFLTPAGRELPGVQMTVQVEVTPHTPSTLAAPAAAPGTPGSARNAPAIYELPSSFAIELFREDASQTAADAYGRMMEQLYPHVAHRAGEVLGTERFGSATTTIYTCGNVRPLPANERVEGSTSGGRDYHMGHCMEPEDEGVEDYEYDEEAPELPEQIYRLVVTERSEVAIRVDADFGAVLYLRTSCSGYGDELACEPDASQIEATLDAGVYYVFVDGGYEGDRGDFEIYASVQPIDAVARACRAASALTLGQSVTGTRVGGEDRTQGLCGGVGSPERLYSVAIAEPARLRCAVDGAGSSVYLRDRCEARNTERGCAVSTTTRPAEVAVVASAGSYTVGVDGDAALDDPGSTFALRCETAPIAGAEGVSADTCEAPGTLDLSSGTTTLTVDTFAARDDVRASCGGAGAPDLLYRFTVDEPSLLRSHWATGGFRGILSVRPACDANALACAGAGAQLDTQLAPGTYLLGVDGSSSAHFGRGEVTVELESLTEVCDGRPMLQSGQRESTTFPAEPRSRFAGSCGGRYGSELVRRFVVERRSRVVLSASLPFSSGAVYLRRQCADPSSEVTCDIRPRAGDAQIDTTLDPGLYYVFVDASTTSPTGAVGLQVDVTPL